ncbi:General negative regulator of transcription subunit 3 [Spathaspora sp. JA1]|nr:General negative regulator of transcription subunit 3 [Spathaspora sp. JA1]
MSARKLQQEFDKTNKKIAEGLTSFDDIYSKLTTTEISSQKEKLESDLKKEIKKLQRSREQLKSWLSDSSIKLDKNLLQENRTRIEHAMDQFKDLEKSSKIKQFSNEGLELQSQKSSRFSRFGVDGDDSKRVEACNYLNDIIEQLNQQNETMEQEIESLGGQSKKGKGGASTSYAVKSSIDDFKYKIERNNTHIEKIETILNNLEEDRVDPAKVDDIKDDLEYYVENNQEEDYVEYDEFYDQLEVDEDEDEVVEVQGSLAQMAAETVEEQQQQQQQQAAKEKQPGAATPAITPATITGSSPSPSAAATTSSNTTPKRKPSIVPAPAPPPIMAYSSAIKAAQQQHQQQQQTTSAPPAITTATTTTASSSASSTPVKMAPPGLNQAPGKSQSPSPLISKPKLEHSEEPIEQPDTTDSISLISSIIQSRLSNPLPFSSITNLVESSLLNCPDSFDAEKPRQYTPTNIHPSSIDYPQEPMYELNNANYMKKFDNDTLFFCFYYSETTNDNFGKWNAAKELSKRNWIYNTELKQWFLKDNKNRSMSVIQKEEPEDSSQNEEANYKYFDYEKTWLTRRRENYRFEKEWQRTF